MFENVGHLMIGAIRSLSYTAFFLRFPSSTHIAAIVKPCFRVVQMSDDITWHVGNKQLSILSWPEQTSKMAASAKYIQITHHKVFRILVHVRSSFALRLVTLTVQCQVI